MFRWLTSSGRPSSARPSREVLLNDALELAMDWGENWLSPIQGRLQQRHKHLQREQLDELNAACQEAMKCGHDTAFQLVRQRGQDASKEEFTAIVVTKFPWLTLESTTRLYNQSLYYAWKTGGPARED